MSTDINTVTLVGRLTRDPEVHTTQNGFPITNLGLAVNTGQKDSDGKWGDKANFFDVKLLGERFKNLAEHLAKGKRIAVQGRLEYSQWESDAGKRSKVEVIANDVQFLDSPKESQQDADTNNTQVASDDIPF